LFGILIFVLVFQANKSPQPAQSYRPSLPQATLSLGGSGLRGGKGALS
jgi:hypothetical protein